MKGAEPINVLTINVRCSTAQDGENDWEKRKDFLLDVVKEGNYDFIGGQEVVLHPRIAKNQLQFLADHLPEYAVLYQCRETNQNLGECSPVFYRKDRWKIDPEEQGTFWLSDTPNEIGSITWEGQSRCPRVVSGGLFHERDKTGTPTGQSLYVYSTHFDHVGEIPRQKSAALVFERIQHRKNKTAPIVLVGDLNCGEDSPAVRFLKGETVELGGEQKVPSMKLLDSFRVAHPGSQNVLTFNGFREPSLDEQGNMMGGKIDYIFISPELKVLDAEIIRTKRDGKYPTDHFPVRATLSFAD